MNEPIVSRERIAQQGDGAARITARTGVIQTNPYPAGTEAAAAWQASYERYLVEHTAAEGAEASA